MKELNDIIDGRVAEAKTDTIVNVQEPDQSLELVVDGEKIYTVKDRNTIISGTIKNADINKNYKLSGNQKEVYLDEQFNFRTEFQLSEGTNYIDIVLYEDGMEKINKSLAVYRKIESFPEKEVVLWVEQFPNANYLQTTEDIEKMMLTAKDAGITSFGIDIKGPEGFVSYKRNDLSNTPYMSEIKHPKKAGANGDIDFLEKFVTLAHKLEMKVFASINVFVEGSIILEESAVLNEHPEWEQIVQRPEDKGALLPFSKSSFKNKLLSFVNPANDEVQEFQLKRFEEVLKNYDIDGVNLDRCRYDNMYADFSEVTREKFESYLSRKNKMLKSWPDDVYKVKTDGSIIKGDLYNDWWCFRSAVIKEFAKRVRELVDKYKKIKGREILLSAYVGSWYEYIYQNGINWASPRFKYDRRLAFPEDSLYTKDYAETAYSDFLDFIMIGTYYETAEEINKYITLGNIITNGELPIYAGMALTEIQRPEVQKEVFQAALNNCNGLMLFDLCYTNWPVQKAAIKNI